MFVFGFVLLLFLVIIIVDVVGDIGCNNGCNIGCDNDCDDECDDRYDIGCDISYDDGCYDGCNVGYGIERDIGSDIGYDVGYVDGWYDGYDHDCDHEYDNVGDGCVGEGDIEGVVVGPGRGLGICPVIGGRGDGPIIGLVITCVEGVVGGGIDCIGNESGWYGSVCIVLYVSIWETQIQTIQIYYSVEYGYLHMHCHMYSI